MAAFEKCGHDKTERNTVSYTVNGNTYEYCRRCVNHRQKMSRRRKRYGITAVNLSAAVIEEALMYMSEPELRAMCERAIEAGTRVAKQRAS